MHIRLENVTRVYSASGGEQVAALSQLELELPPGAFHAVVGPSGSGKTTLLNILGCLDTPTQGNVYFDSQEVSRLPERRRIVVRRRQIGYVFQSFNLIPTLTAFENASLPFWSESAKLRKVRRQALDEAFMGLGIAELGHRYPKELSGGQEQRVAIARALANQPQLILADEPTGNLDQATSIQIINLLRDQNERFKTTVLVATHDHVLLDYFDGVISLRDGWLQGVERRK
jgi:putative ABC transport system ATP-binding protein